LDNRLFQQNRPFAACGEGQLGVESGLSQLLAFSHICHLGAEKLSAILESSGERPQAAPVEVLNDINGDLVTLYRVVQNHLEEFVRQFKWALSSRQVFEWQKMTRPETLTDIQCAARFFYLQHHAFAGKVTGQAFGTATGTHL
jgi:hypothetical protein